MNEKYVVSLELARKMRELGFKQESDFYWSFVNEDYCELITRERKESPVQLAVLTQVFAAYHVGELGEMCKWQHLSIAQPPKYLDFIDGKNTEADARALWLIYIAENKLIDPTKL